MKKTATMEKKSNAWVPGWYAEQDPPPVESITVQIDGKDQTLAPADIVNLIAQQASATKKTQQVAAILQAAEKYGMSAEDYVSQADGAFAVLQDGITQKIIDEKGNFLVKPGDKAPVIPPANPPANASPELTEIVNRLGVAERALADIAKVDERIGMLEKDTSHLFRKDMEAKIKAAHPELNDKDISDVFVSTMRDPKKAPIWDHAKAKATEVGTMRSTIRREALIEAGIDPDKFDENKLKEQSGDTGASGMFKDKKFSFKKKDPNALSPREAAHAFIQKQQAK